MANDNNIDALFRDNLSNRDFEFNQKHWEAAEKLIEAYEKKRKNWLGGKTVLIFIGIGLLLSLAGGFFIFNNKTLENKTTSLNNTTSEINNSTSIPEEERKQLTKNAKETAISPGEIIPGKPEIKTAQKRNIQAIPENHREEINPVYSEATNSLEAVNSPEKAISTEGKIKSVQEEIKKASEKNEGKSLNETVQSESVNNPSEITRSQNEKELENSDLSSETKSDQNKTVIIESETGIPENEKIISEGKPANVKEENTISTLEKNEKEQTQIPEDEPESEILSPSVITLNKESTPVEENTPEVALEQQETKKPLKDRLNWLRHLSIGITSGANFSQGFINTGNSRAGFSSAPSGGLRVAYQLNEQVDIESGLVYSYRSGLNSKTTTLTSRDISNNTTRYSTNTALNLHYIDWPVHLTYKYGKHSFIVGMHYAHLINTRTGIVDTKEENGNTTIEKSSKQWSKNDGRFSSFDLAGIIGYEYSITDRIKICGRYNYGLFDVTDDNSFGNSVRDKNNQFRIMLDYRFMKY